MDKYWSLLVAVIFYTVTLTAAWERNWQKFKPPHHWHDCGSSEQDWNKQPVQKWKDRDDFDNSGWGQNNGGWVYPDQKPRPPWPRPKPTPQPTPTPRPTTTQRPIVSSTKSPKDIQECMKTCPVTSQYNPVCGTDGVTYANIGRLECARFCGVDVQLSRSSKCPTNDGSSSTTTTTISPRPDVQACISRCPVTPEYNPVCGSDGVTYTNPGRLECARICGVNVQLSRNSRCPDQPVTIPTPAPITTPSNNGASTISQDILDLIFTTTTEADTTGLIDERHDDD